MYVIGTAGHVDHGKSTLVQALTGIDPDRLQEEKQRGLTIDLGFAWLELPSGEEVSIVDVPGHERFVNNMLAGVGGIDMALLVVAADESVMPQTREHVAILDLLNVDRGLVALTKRDLAEEDWLDLVTADVEELIKGTSLEESKIVPVSGSTGEGLPELVAEIEAVLQETPQRQDLGRPRLPIDRSFTISGFGTVVTGTLIDGAFEIGQEVEIVPGGETTRIRGLQSHKTKTERALPGTRVAANLANIAQEEIVRGEVLATRGWLRPTDAIDVQLQVIPGSPRPLRHNMHATIHTGSNEVVGRVRLLERDRAEPGEATWAQLKLDQPVAVVKGDHFVIRSSATTLGGGSVVDTHAPRHRRNHGPTLDRLSVMTQGSEGDVLVSTIESAEPADLKTIVDKANLQPDAAASELEVLTSSGQVIALGSGEYYYSAGGWQAVGGQAASFLDGYHKDFPMRRGAPKEELRSRLKMAPQVFSFALARLAEDGVVAEEGTTARRSGHAPKMPPEMQRAAGDYIRSLESSPYSPPTDIHVDEELLNLLAEERKVVKVGDSVVFAASVYDEMVARVTDTIDQKGEITVADVRDLFGNSRKYALGLLEHLDAERVTQRVGDARVLR